MKRLALILALSLLAVPVVADLVINFTVVPIVLADVIELSITPAGGGNQGGYVEIVHAYKTEPQRNCLLYIRLSWAATEQANMLAVFGVGSNAELVLDFSFNSLKSSGVCPLQSVCRSGG